MNSAYKHLDAKLKFAELTVGQWFGLMLGVGVAIAWGFFLSPFGTYLSAGTAVYLGAMPAGLAFMSGFYEIDLWVVMCAAVVWIRLDGRFMPGPGQQIAGYVVRPDRLDQADPRATSSAFDLAALWES